MFDIVTHNNKKKDSGFKDYSKHSNKLNEDQINKKRNSSAKTKKHISNPFVFFFCSNIAIIIKFLNIFMDLFNFYIFYPIYTSYSIST